MTRPLDSTDRVFVSDFDGTMTAFDFFERVRAHLPAGTPDYWAQYQAGQLGHFRALQAIFAELRGEESQVLRIVHETQLDPQLPHAVRRLQENGWRVLVVSAGCQWYITRLLQEQNLHLEVISNPGMYDPARGLEMTLPTDSPFFSAEVGIDKPAVVRHELQAQREVAFAGDGRPDLPAARLVLPERRFARGWLAEALRAEGLPFRGFTRWSEIAEMLLEDSSPR